MRRFWQIGFWCSAAVLGPPAARAGDKTEPAKVEDLVRRGNDFWQEGHDSRALPLFQEAYEGAPTPRTAAQLGLVEMALGYKVEAERHLAEAVGSPRDAWMSKNRAVLESSLATVRASIGELTIGGPAGADVTVGGKSVGSRQSFSEMDRLDPRRECPC